MSHAAFWTAIRAEPNEDTPRLVYADWLDEQGDGTASARAEFIRAQIELTRLDPWTERAVDLKIREAALLQEHRDAWLAELPKWANRDEVRFVRGFPYSQRCSIALLVKHAASLAEDTVVQDVTSEGANPLLKELAASAALTRVRGLELRQRTLRDVKAVFASPHLTGLREWRFDHTDAPASTADGLASALSQPAVKNISRLALQLGRRPPNVLAAQLGALAAIPFTRLRELRLRVFASPPVPIASVLHSPLVREVTSYSGYLDEGVFEEFGASHELPALRSVDFSVNGRRQEWLEWGFASPLLRHVVALELNGLENDGFRHLTASPLAERLRNLILPTRLIAAATFRANGATGRFQNLLALALDVSSWTQREMYALAIAPGFEAVRHLHLVGLAGTTAKKLLTALSSSKHWPNVRGVTVPLPSGDPEERKAFAAKHSGRFAVLVE